jgi:hypothetical protein
MANYFMLGGDGKEYGPIPADQLRQWATEGRANSQTQVRSADGGTWTSFRAVPELYESGSGSEDTVKRLASVLASGSGWMKFLAVLMFIYGGFCILTITGIIFAWIPIWLGVVPKPLTAAPNPTSASRWIKCASFSSSTASCSSSGSFLCW